MIGTFIFFGLYPLTRFINRVSDAVKKSNSPVLLNGGGVWDGEAKPTRRFTKTQTSLLDLWISGPVKAKKETVEMLNDEEPGLEEKNGIKENVKRVMEKEEKSVNQEMGDKLTKNSGIQVRTQGNADVLRELQEERVREKNSRHQMEDTNVFSETLTIDTPEETELVSIEESNNSELAQESSIKTSELPNGDQNQSVIDSTTEESRANVLDRQVDALPTVNTSQVEEAECENQIKVLAKEEHWDEHIDSDTWYSGTGGPGTDLQSWTSPSHADQAGWHFAIGPGLGDMVYCPAWQFPAMSYYPTVEEATPFEMMWRVWEEVDELEEVEEVSAVELLPSTSASRAVFDFTVMSYNILAQDLLEANQHLYSHCPLEVLQWEYRLQNLLQEILKWEADILCLQEVQENHFEKHLQPALSNMGYTCVFKRRTGAKTDGCAICYRGDRFSQQSVSLLEFLRPQCPLLDRDNVAVVLLLQPVITQGSEVTAKGPPLCVANTHLLFNPSRGDVKLAQLAVLIAEVQRVVEGCQVAGNPCHVILCGDFNSVPNMPLYQLITRGQLHYHGLPSWMVSGQEDMSYKAHQRRLYAPLWPSSLGITDHCQYTSGPARPEQPVQEAGGVRYSHDFMLQLRFCDAAFVRPQNLEMIPGVTDITPDAEAKHQQPLSPSFRNTVDHSLNLRSVYRHVLPGFNRPEVTTVHSEVGATVDYIFYTAGHDHRGYHQGGGQPAEELKLVRRLSLLCEDDLWSMNGLPNHMFPSDHLSLLARFQLEVPLKVPARGSS